MVASFKAYVYDSTKKNWKVIWYKLDTESQYYHALSLSWKSVTWHDVHQDIRNKNHREIIKSCVPNQFKLLG